MNGGNKLLLLISKRVEEVRAPEPPARCARSLATRVGCHKQLGRRDTEKRGSSQSGKMETMADPDLSQSAIGKQGKFPPVPALGPFCLSGRTSYQRPMATSRLSSATCMNAFPSHWKLPGHPSTSLRTLLSKPSATSTELKQNLLELFLKLINLFLAALGLRCCAQAFSSCGGGGYSLLRCAGSHCGGLSCCGARALGARASVVVARGLSSCGTRALVAPRHVGSSRTRAQTHVLCVGRRILNHCAIREVPEPVGT